MFANLAIALVSLLSVSSVVAECPTGHLCATGHTDATCASEAAMALSPVSDECYDFSGLCGMFGFKEADCIAPITRFFPIKNTQYSAKMTCGAGKASATLYSAKACSGEPVGTMTYSTGMCKAFGPGYVRFPSLVHTLNFC